MPVASIPILSLLLSCPISCFGCLEGSPTPAQRDFIKSGGGKGQRPTEVIPWAIGASRVGSAVEAAVELTIELTKKCTKRAPTGAPTYHTPHNHPAPRASINI